METHSRRLLGRLDDIGASLARSGHALALIGLGSVGTQRDRLDEYSDLDFFVIAEPGYVSNFINNLSWLEEVAPVAFSFQNTDDGCKVLFEDGIYAEFAVFDPARLADITADTGRVVWANDGVHLASLEATAPPADPPQAQWLTGEILTNLYVGLMRLRRGERLSAARLIQGHAIDRLLDLCALLEPPAEGARDVFDRARRVERRFPSFAQHLPSVMQGYERSVESALAILDVLRSYGPVDAVMERSIQEAARLASSGE